MGFCGGAEKGLQVLQVTRLLESTMGFERGHGPFEFRGFRGLGF